MEPRAMWILAACALLVALAGCDVFLAVPLSVTPVVQSVAIDATEGCATATWTVSGKGIIRVDYGDGQAETLEIDAEIPRVIEHTYPRIGSYVVRFIQGRGMIAATVAVTCTLPKVAPPFYLNPLVEEGERVSFNFTRRDVGCDNGMVQYFSGIDPGDGTTEFRVTAYYSRGGKVSIFDDAGRNVWGEWIELEPIRRELQVLTVWAGWAGNAPLIPMGSKALAELLDCGSPCPDDPWIPPMIPSNAEYMTFTLTVRNQYMGPVDYLSTAWRIAVSTGACGSD